MPQGCAARLGAGDVEPASLLIDQRMLKHPKEYSHETVTVAALKRSVTPGAALEPGQRVPYVVADDDASGTRRVRLAFESSDEYDVDWYRALALRAAESVLLPVGWNQEEIYGTSQKRLTER